MQSENQSILRILPDETKCKKHFLMLLLHAAVIHSDPSLLLNTTTQNNLNNLQFMWFVYQRLITYSKDINQQKRDARFDSCIHHEQFLVAKRKDEWWLIVVNHTIEVFSFIFVYIVFILYEYQTLLGSLQEVQWLWPRPTKHRSFSPTWVAQTCPPNSICRWK